MSAGNGSKEAGRWAQLEAREKELKGQLKECKEIKEGWDRMKAELKTTKEQFNKLNAEYTSTVAICRNLKLKTTQQQKRIEELEKLLAALQKNSVDPSELEARDRRIRELMQERKQCLEKQTELQEQILKLIQNHATTATSLQELQTKHKTLLLDSQRCKRELGEAGAQLESAVVARDAALERERGLANTNLSLQTELDALRSQLEQATAASEADRSESVSKSDESKTVESQGGNTNDANTDEGIDPAAAELLARRLLETQNELRDAKEKLELANAQLKNCTCSKTGQDAAEQHRPDETGSETNQGHQDEVRMLKEKLAQVMSTESDLRQQVDDLRKENETEVQKRQATLSELSAEKATSASRAAQLREREDEIAKLKLAAMKSDKQGDTTGNQNDDGSGNKKPKPEPPAPTRKVAKTKKGLMSQNMALLQELEVLKMMVDGAKKEVARRDKMIRRLKKSHVGSPTR